jgi:cellobiose transport system permease protein
MFSRWDIKFSPYIYIAPFFALFGVFGLYPLLMTAYMSLTDWNLIGDRSFVGLENYAALIRDEYFWNAVRNTFAIFLVATIPQMIMALFLAQLLNRPLRARTFWRMIIFVPNVTSLAAVAVVFGVFFRRDFGVVNYFLGFLGVDPISWRTEQWPAWIALAAMIDWRWTGYNTLIFLAAMQAIPKDLYESAALDGAGRWRQFLSITLPGLRPTLFFVVIISTIGGWQLDHPQFSWRSLRRRFRCGGVSARFFHVSNQFFSTSPGKPATGRDADHLWLPVVESSSQNCQIQ